MKEKDINELEEQYRKMPKFGKNKTEINNIIKLLRMNQKLTVDDVEKIQHLILKEKPKKKYKGYTNYNYTNDILPILEVLSDSLESQDVFNTICKNSSLSRRQLKLIRQIVKNGTKEDIEILSKDQYTIISIAKLVKIRKRITKRFK